MVEWSRPRTTPMSGHRKATERYCLECEKFHRTRRHPNGEELCAMLKKAEPVDFPAIKIKIPKNASK